MAFVVEDGSGLATSTSYMTVVDFKLYWTDRGTTFTEEDAVIETWLIIGTEFIDNFYQFFGVSTYPTVQALQFPRTGLRDNKKVLIPGSTIPVQLTNALCRLAKVAKTHPDLATIQDTGIKSKRIGPVSTTYKDGYLVEFKNAINYLRGFIKRNSGLQILT